MRATRCCGAQQTRAQRMADETIWSHLIRFGAALRLDDNLVFVAVAAHAVIEAERIFVVTPLLYGAGVCSGIILRKALVTTLLYKALTFGHAGLVRLVPQAGGDDAARDWRVGKLEVRRTRHPRARAAAHTRQCKRGQHRNNPNCSPKNHYRPPQPLRATSALPGSPFLIAKYYALRSGNCFSLSNYPD